MANVDRSLDYHAKIPTATVNDKLVSQDGTLDYDELKKLVTSLGAHDVGFVDIDRPSMAQEKRELHQVFPAAKSLISIVVRANR